MFVLFNVNKYVFSDVFFCANHFIIQLSLGAIHIPRAQFFTTFWPLTTHVDIFYEKIDIIGLQKQGNQKERCNGRKFGFTWVRELKQGLKSKQKVVKISLIYLVSFQYILRRLRETCVHVDCCPTPRSPLWTSVE